MVSQVGEDASMNPLVVGRRNSLLSTLTMAAVLVLVFPGFGLLILPSVFSGDKVQWGGLAWVTFWALPPFVVRALQREHRLDGSVLVSTYRNRVVSRLVSDVVGMRPAPLFMPAARIRFGDGSLVWAYGPAAEALIAAVMHGAPFADDQLPSGKWLRPRRVVWFVLEAIDDIS
jgi:hypothetical protein